MPVSVQKAPFVPFFSVRAADGNGAAFYNQTFEVMNGQQNLRRIKGTLYWSGGFGSGVGKLQAYDGVTWFDVAGVTRTTVGYQDVDIDAVALRAVLTGATGATLTMMMVSANEFVEKAA